ncbi:MAG TPA: hypothetical protein VGK41_01195 [Solirubrobacterales bacterium]
MVDKVLMRDAGVTKQYTPVVASAGAADAGKIPALGPDGMLDPSLYEPGTDPTEPITASEALGAGKFVNKWNDAGTLKVRLADNSNGRPAHGFVRDAVSSAATATVYGLDAVNDALSGLTIAGTYYLGTAGGVIDTPLDPTDVGNDGYIDQKLGIAKSATELATDDYDYVVL